MNIDQRFLINELFVKMFILNLALLVKFPKIDHMISGNADLKTKLRLALNFDKLTQFLLSFKD